MHRFPSLALGFCLSWSLTLRPADAVPPDPVDPDPTDAALLDQERDEIVGSEDFQPVRVALLEGRGADAARELETLLGKGENEDLFWMLQATAWRLGGDDERALAVLEKILEDRGGAFRHKAAFMKADILAREKRFRDAVEIYTREILRLTSSDRKRELAGIYIRFADSYFEGNGGKAGGEGGKAKAYDKARDFYTRSLDVGPGDEEAARVRFRIGRCLYEEKKFAAAVKYFEAELRTRSTGPRADEMAYYLGLAKLSIGDAVGARRTFLDLLRDHPESELRPQATYQTAKTFGLPVPADDENLERGVRYLRDLVRDGNGERSLLGDAALGIGLSYAHRGKDEEAVRAFRDLVEKFGGEPDVKEVALAWVRIGDARFRQRRLEDAVAAWKEFLAGFPAHSEWRSTQRKLVDVEYTVGFDAFRDERYDEAATSWGTFLERYPLDERSPGIYVLIGKIHYEKERFDEAVVTWRRVVSKYPGTEEASEAQYWVGVTLEKKLARFDEARKAYERLDWGGYQAKARERIVALDSKHLSLLTERSFRTREPVTLALTTRNIEELEMRLYHLDGEAYFRKTHTFRGMEDLDLALIEPDKLWTYEIPDYEKHREIASTATLPVSEAGLYVVTTGDDELEATTVVVVTDIAVAVKAGRRDILVYAQDAKTNRPRGGCRVLVSDGKRIILEGTTGDDGFFHAADKALKSARDVRVFAWRESSYGGTRVGLRGIRYVEGLQPRAFIHTDRPAYRPGESVRYRGIVRGVENGAYAFTEGEKWDVEVVASTGDVVESRTAELSATGTFAGEVVLPETSPVGTYKVICRRKSGPVFSGQFEVWESQIPQMRLEIDVERSVYLRGESITGKIRALYSHGGPVAGRAVTYQFRGASEPVRGVTDEKGELAFEFDTRDLAESQVITLWTRIDDEPVETQRALWIATTEYTLAVETLRGVYFAGEGFEVTARARGLDGGPLARKLTLVASRIVEEDGRRGEVEVSRSEVETDATTGEVRASLKLEQAGRHVLRVEGTDRFGNRIVGSRAVYVSGDDDEVKLRFVSGERFRLGGEASVGLHSRTDGPVAVLIYEGETIHRYETRPIVRGLNELKIDLGRQESPNFRLTAMVVSGDRFDTTHKDFLVERGLDIALEPEKTTARPGEEISVRVRTQDRVGKDTSAEVAIAVVDQAVLDLFDDPLPGIRDVFYGGRRGISSAQASSAAFRYKGTTRAVSRQVLDEERLAAERGVTPRRPAINAPILGDEPLVGVDLSRLRPGQHDALVAQRAIASLALQQGQVQQQLALREVENLRLSVQHGRQLWRFDLASLSGIGGAAGAGEAADASARERALLAATAYWNPSVRTDASGRGEVRFRLPDRSGRWRIVCFGATADTLVGQADVELQTRRDLVLEIRAPESVTAGDRTSVDVVVHNLGENERTVPLVFTAKNGERTETFRREVTVGAEGTASVSFPLEVLEGSTLELEVRHGPGAGDDRDRDARSALATVPIVPWATELRTGTGGVATQDVVRFLELDVDDARDRRLEIVVGPSLEASLLDLAGSIRSFGRRRGALASRGLVLVEVLDYLRSTGAVRGRLWNRTEREFEGVLAALFVSQGEEGGWSWTAVASSPDPYVTAAAYRVLARGAALGLRVPAKYRNKAEAFMDEVFSRADDTTKTILVHALSHGDRVDFSAVNRLYRMRQSLGAYALAHLALTLEGLGRDDLAREVALVLVSKNPFEVASSRDLSGRRIGWIEDPTELVAVSALAIARVDPRSSKIEEAVEWLQSHRRGRRWSSDKGTAAAAALLREYLTRSRPRGEAYDLTVTVGEREVKTFRFRRGSTTETLVVSGAGLPAGKVRVAFSMDGNGTFSYTVVLSARVDGIRQDAHDRFVRVRHHHRPSPRVVDGKRIPSGYGTVVNARRVDNLFTELAVGETGTVQVQIDNRERGEGYLVHEEYLPAGAGVIPGSIGGNFQYHERRAGKIVFYFEAHQRYGQLRYDLYGRLPGTYRMLPSVTYPAFRTDRLTTGAERALKVLAAGEKRSDEYTPTPDELYHVGKLHFDRDRHADAKPHLLNLFGGYRLKDSTFKDVARMLMQIGLAEDDSAAVVRYFEILKERYPELVLTFDDMIRVGGAYTAMEEFERALQVYRGIAEARFIMEGNIAGALNSQGEFLAALDLSERLLSEFPDLPEVVERGYGLAHVLYEASGRVGEIEELRGRRLTKRDLIEWAAKRLRRFLLFHPASVKADEAAFTLAAAYLDLGEYQEGIDLTEKMRQRFPKSSYVDQFLYVDGYARFWLGDHKSALELLRRVESESFPSVSGDVVPSEDRKLATYLIGQIFHAMRDFDRAMEKYRAVQKEFSDADEAIRDLEKKALALPEVTRVNPGGDVTVKLTYRNVPEARVICYKVDLLKLYLLRRNLDGIANIKLAGIQPYHSEHLRLGEGKDYRSKSVDVSLPLREAGAYLLVVKGSELDASGMVLVSSIDLEVSEDAVSGRVRATVVEKGDRAYVSRAHVKVIGEGNEEFLSGSTDLRGLFLADGVKGRVTVVAKNGPEYAFYRGKTSLGGYQRRTPGGSRESGKAGQSKSKGQSAAEAQKELLEGNVQILNRDNNKSNMMRIQEWFSNDVYGCSVMRVR